MPIGPRLRGYMGSSKQLGELPQLPIGDEAAKLRPPHFGLEVTASFVNHIGLIKE